MIAIAGAIGLAVPTFDVRAESTASTSPAAGGADSPEQAVEELLDSVRASDPLGLLAVLHPAERVLVDNLYTSSSAAADSTGGIDVDAVLQAVRLEVTTAPLVVEPLSDRVAWVTTATADVMLNIDVEAADEALALDLSDAEFDQPSEAFAPGDDDLGVAVVREGDHWFVSAMYTAAEHGRRRLELPARVAPTSLPSGSATEPTDAVVALLSAVSEKDPRALSSTLSPFEARLVADYESTIGGELIEALAAYDVNISSQHLQVIEEDDEVAVVEVDAWSVSVTGGDEYGVVDFGLDVSGLCADVRSYDDFDGTYSESAGCAFNESTAYDVGSVLVDVGWRGPRFVLEKQDGVWSVSLLRTVLYTLAPLVDDPLTAVSVVGMLGFGDGFYEGAIDIIGAEAKALPAGESTVETQGAGRAAIFRVSGPATVTVDSSAGDCEVQYFDPAADDWIDFLECDESYRVLGELLGVASSGYHPFTGPWSLGTVTVVVE